MKAMILAAGRGERMRPLTDTCPKPLLEVGGKPLIVWHIEALVRAGIQHVVINHAHLGALIEQALGDGSRWGAQIVYSPEVVALETAGGIAQALPLLTNEARTEPFLVVNGDVYTELALAKLPALMTTVEHRGDQPTTLAHLVLVPNPAQHPAGDFVLSPQGLVLDKPAASAALGRTGTFSGIGIYHPGLFKNIPVGQAAKLAPLLREAMSAQQVTGTWYDGVWMDVGTPERLRELDQRLSGL